MRSRAYDTLLPIEGGGPGWWGLRCVSLGEAVRHVLPALMKPGGSAEQDSVLLRLQQPRDFNRQPYTKTMVPLLAAFLLTQTGETAAVERLERTRGSLFLATNRLKDSGYERGPEGSSHDIYFPLGRADRLYYASYVSDFGQNARLRLTCWSRKGSTRPTKEWSLLFRMSKKQPMRKGALMRVLQGYSSDWSAREQAAWGLRKAQTEFAKKQALVHYHFGQHGEGASQGRVRVVWPSGTPSESEVLETISGNRLKVPVAEAEAMRKRPPHSALLETEPFRLDKEPSRLL